ncbi:MAG: 1-acyl-sn-glycerol-3-phosphate acyltransferase [Curvibacter sp.]|nr:1-acyl-sn-glycerol-3-phosphate acyltransferase [Curvibacter sp.]
MRSAARAPLACWRLLRALLHILSGLWIVWRRFPRLSAGQRENQVQAWARAMLHLLGIALQVQGRPVAQGPALMVCNHISWLDILVLHAGRHCRFVSKSEIRRWPLIGRLATAAGTLYIERSRRRDAMRVVHDMAASLRAGDIVAVFPEGTTGDGRELLPFHANLLQAAISAPAPVQPVALKFVDARSGQRSLAPCYIGDDSLLGSLWRTLTAPPIVALVCYGELQAPQGQERRAWAASLQAAVDDLAEGARRE